MAIIKLLKTLDHREARLAAVQLNPLALAIAQFAVYQLLCKLQVGQFIAFCVRQQGFPRFGYIGKAQLKNWIMIPTIRCATGVDGFSRSWRTRADRPG